MRLSTLPPRLFVLVPWLAISAACGQNTDTSVSETATAVTTGGSTGLTGTGEDAETGELTGGLTGTGGDDAGAPGTTGTSGASTGPEPETASGATLETTTLTTGEPQSTGASVGDTTGSEIEDCQELAAAFASEAMEIRNCTAAEQCGQELKGTSCGCTHNWVARTDADTDHFFELLGMADRLGCELILAGTCDCPPADGFTCTDGICAWKYL